LEVLLNSFIQGNLQTFLDELRKKNIQRENLVSMRWWSVSLSSNKNYKKKIHDKLFLGLLLCFLEVCTSDELAVYQERFPALFCNLQKDLYNDPYDAVCKTLSQIEGIMASSDIVQNSASNNTFNLNKGERFDDKKEIANSRACHQVFKVLFFRGFYLYHSIQLTLYFFNKQLIKICTKEIQLTGFIFSLLKRLLRKLFEILSKKIASHFFLNIIFRINGSRLLQSNFRR
jgi:hypothetical protein